MTPITIWGRTSGLRCLAGLAAGAILLGSGVADAAPIRPAHAGHPAHVGARHHGAGGSGDGMAAMMGGMADGSGGVMGRMGEIMGGMHKISAALPGGTEMLNRSLGAAMVMGGIVPSPVGGDMKP